MASWPDSFPASTHALLNYQSGQRPRFGKVSHDKGTGVNIVSVGLLAILAWVGAALCVLFLAILLLWRVELRRRKRYRTAISSVLPEDLPAQISVEICQPRGESDKVLVRIRAQMEQLSFRSIGCFSIAQIPAMEFHAMVHENRWCYATLRWLEGYGYASFEFHAIQEDGLVLELISSPGLHRRTKQPGKEKQFVSGWSPELAYTLFKKMCRDRALRLVTEEEFANHLEWDWASGFRYREELRAVETAGGKGEG